MLSTPQDTVLVVENEKEAHGLSRGAIDYIAKPINPAIITAQIQTYLDLRRIRRRLQP